MKIWDMPTRMYHWIQALLFIALAVSGYTGMGASLHPWLGAILMTLLLWRLGWGLIGSETARFAQFFPSPGRLVNYLRGHGRAHVGHNPIGALMVIALVGMLLLQGATGMVMSDWIDGREFFGRSTMRTLKNVHELNAMGLLLFSSVHIAVVLIYKLNGRDLIKPMITGNNRIKKEIPLLKFASNRKAFALLIACVISMLTAVNLLA